MKKLSLCAIELNQGNLFSVFANYLRLDNDFAEYLHISLSDDSFMTLGIEVSDVAWGA